MIDGLIVRNQATYSADGVKLEDLKQVNYFFGTNGAGKTTISRVISDPSSYTQCSISWSNNRELDRFVYNCDFFSSNFTEQMAGIFTLGEEDASIERDISRNKETIQKLEESIARLDELIDGADGKGGKNGYLGKSREDAREKCWRAKTTHDAYFGEAFKGNRGTKELFFSKSLQEHKSNTSELLSIDQLKDKSEKIYSKNPEKVSYLGKLSAEKISSISHLEVLKRPVIGKNDVNISKLIARLNNSDWVRNGIEYLPFSDSSCPFCQQNIDDALASELNNYFDESYKEDVSSIDQALLSYQTLSKDIIGAIDSVIAQNHKFVAEEKLSQRRAELMSIINENFHKLDRKKSEPSSICELQDISIFIEQINSIIEEANSASLRHNNLVDNLSNEKATLTRQIWRFIAHELDPVITTYNADREKTLKEIEGLAKARTEKFKKMAELTRDLQELERRVTSVIPTVNQINNILSSFGFTNFSLRQSTTKENFYEIVRSDGSNAAKTLSEGEKSFITFLYFYHLVRGGKRAEGVTSDRIIVIDDPVSSLDSDVLFIVSTLIKKLISDAYEGKDKIKQVIILTHNIYFHKEVSFDPTLTKVGRMTFWMVRKRNNVTRIERSDKNPIMTSYQLLWEEIKRPDCTGITLQNTLRRILESYFKVFGGMTNEDIISRFSGQEQQVCASLFSWINDGSHNAYDEICMSLDDTSIESYKNVFKQIFEKTKHEAHYHMMMGKDHEVAPVNNAS